MQGGDGSVISTIHDYLGQFTGKEVAYFPNPGNAGDSLMASATYQALERAGAHYRVPDPRGYDADGRFVLYGGGGNLHGRGRHSYRTLKRLHGKAKHLTILPHTIRDVDDLLAEFGSNVTVIAREPVTFDYLNSIPRRYETLLMDDVAFSLDVAKLTEGGHPFSTPAMLADFAASRLFRRRAHTSFENVRRYAAPGGLAEALRAREPGGVLHCFRLDDEASGIAIPEDNVDVALLYMFGVAPQPVADHASRSLLEVVATYDAVHTNRLHVAIAAALIGRPTFLYRNSYYKCQAVYEFSMRERFANVTWMG